MHGKRFIAAKQSAAKVATTVDDAATQVKQMATAKFDETVELVVRLGIDPRKGDQQVRATVVLPHGTGKTKRVAAFVDPANEQAAKDAGADIVATEETIGDIVKTGKIDFDVAVAVPAMMPKLAKAAKILGPRGLMPNPKTDTVGPNIAKMIQEQKAGKVSFENDSTCNVHMIVGKASFDATKIAENAKVALEAIKKAKPASSKGIYIRSAYLSSTMSPSVKLDTATL